MVRKLRALIVDDSEDDSILLLHALRKGGYEPIHKRVDTAVSMQTALGNDEWDLVIADYVMPQFSGLQAIELLKVLDLDLPCIIVSGRVGEDVAVEAMRAGAQDYISKGNLSRLPAAVHREMAQVATRRERRQVQEALGESEDKYRAIFDSFYDVYFCTNRDGIITLVSPSVKARAGYDPEELVGRPASDIYVNPHDPVIVQRQIETGGEVIGRELSIRAKDGRVIFASLNAHMVFDRYGYPQGIEGVLHDITARRKAEIELQETVFKLEKTIQGTVEALSRMSEVRDPYTAGHQRRVSLLVSAIGEEMHLNRDQVCGLNMAAAIHDLGKIQVPAEILAKPGRISKMEFDILKMHPKVGFDILRAIDFPWPIADIVAQHHERMNGSGYPTGMIGDNILLEARILAVADVVEAMSSHRPYRPALGIQKALDEISDNAGRLYDIPVVNACLKIFAQGYFQFDPC